MKSFFPAFIFLFVGGALSGCIVDDSARKDGPESWGREGILSHTTSLHGEALFMLKIEERVPAHAMYRASFRSDAEPGAVFLSDVAQTYWNEEDPFLLLGRGRARAATEGLQNTGAITPPFTGTGDIVLMFYAFSTVPGELEVQVDLRKGVTEDWHPVLNQNIEPKRSTHRFSADGKPFSVDLPLEPRQDVLVFFKERLAPNGGERTVEAGPGFPHHWYRQGHAEGCNEIQGVLSAFGSPSFDRSAFPIQIEETAKGYSMQELEAWTWESGASRVLAEAGLPDADLVLTATEECRRADFP